MLGIWIDKIKNLNWRGCFLHLHPRTSPEWKKSMAGTFAAATDFASREVAAAAVEIAELMASSLFNEIVHSARLVAADIIVAGS